MKNYDFSKHELWFSFRALQVLAGARREAFIRHTKRIWRIVIRNKDEGQIEWRQDEVYLPRKEGNRDVIRKTKIYDLNTSYTIMSGYSKKTPLNYSKILSRFEMLRSQNRREYNNKLSFAAGLQEFPFIRDDYQDEKLLEILAEISSKDNIKRKRIILDLRNNIFKLILEKGDLDYCSY